MRRLAVILGATAAILCAGVIAWRAEAMVVAGAAQLSAAAKTAGPVVPAACGGRGAHCPPGYTWTGYRCVPC